MRLYFCFLNVRQNCFVKFNLFKNTSRMKTDYCGGTDIGNVRAKNEDAFVLKEIWSGTHLLCVVVDGVGGNGGGDVAANLACKCIADFFNDSSVVTDGLESLVNAVIFANNTICSQHFIPSLSQMCCVLTAALIDLETGKLCVAHVGDTRLYVLQNGELVQITKDHSYVGELEESGQISEAEAMVHSRRNIISRCIGQRMLYDGSEYIQTHTLHLGPCTLMLCSDGLYDMVHSSQMVKILQEPLPPNELVDKLIAAALAAGGKDNVTSIVVDLTK